MLLLGLGPQAFQLSESMLHGRGVMESVDLDPVTLRAKLFKVVAESGHLSGSDVRGRPFIVQCLDWLHERGRHVELLELGDYCPAHLLLFLQVCFIQPSQYIPIPSAPPLALLTLLLIRLIRLWLGSISWVMDPIRRQLALR